MITTAVYVRTEKGAEEVAHRSQAIPSKVRSLLLLIDGKLTGAQLIDKFSVFPNSAEYLQQLEDGGYIEAQAGAAAAAASAPVHSPAASEAAGAVPQAGLNDAKRLIVQTLHEALGPEADYLTTKIDSALTAAELRVHAEKYRDMLVDMGKPKKSAVFWQAFEALLPPD
jgi:hypothetical protein